MGPRFTFVALLALMCAACAKAPDDPPSFQDDLTVGEPNATEGHSRGDGAESTPAPARTATSTPADAVPAPATPSAPPPAVTDTVWVGSLSKSTAVAFGGGGYCNYKVQYTDIKVRVVTTSGGVVKSSEVSGAMSETAPDCAYPVITPNVHSFAYTAPASSPGLAFTFAGSATNNPRTEVAFDGSLRGTTLQVVVTFHRTDQGAPFDWTVPASLVLQQAVAN